MPRTPEEGHTFECLSRTMIAMIENHRDYLKEALVPKQFWADALDGEPKALIDQGLADHDFRIWAQDNNALHSADEWLKENPTSCICDTP